MEKPVSVKQKDSCIKLKDVLCILGSLFGVVSFSLVLYFNMRQEATIQLLKNRLAVVEKELLKMERAEVLDREKRETGDQEGLGDVPFLRGPPGKDGRDGRDGRDGKDCQDDLLERLNVTIAHGLLRYIKNNNRKLIEVLEEQQDGGGSESSKETPEEGKPDSEVSGSTYVRWGKKRCGNTTQELYSGFAAGQYYSHAGGASNYICLPLKPQYKSYTTSDTGNWIYGAEYETGSHIFPKRMHDHNVPCARCYLPGRTTVMIPARRTCPPHWTKEYEGYLMSGHHSQNRANNYVCMDGAPEALDGLQANKDGALFYFVQGSCHHLGQCPPYIHTAELTCVVCSK